MKIVFIGDSITECGRDKADPQSLGDGYVAILREKLKNLYEDVRFEFLNRGVSHDRVADVQARIQKDVADEHPDICVVLIGVNDVLRKYDAGAALDFDAVAASYEDALKQVKACGAKLIAVEPFLLDVPSKRRLRADFNTLVHIISSVAGQYADAYVPLDEMFNGVSQSVGVAAYSADGVHPTHRASRLIADNIIKKIKLFL